MSNDITQSAIEQDLQEIKTENDLSKVLRELTNNDNLLKKTELSRSELNKLAILKGWCRKFQFDFLDVIIDNNLELRVSSDRKGRGELVQVAQAEIIRQDNIINAQKQMNEIKKI